MRIATSTTTTTTTVTLGLLDAPTVLAPYSHRELRPDTIELTLIDGEPLSAVLTGPRILPNGDQGATCEALFAWRRDDLNHRWPEWLRNLATAYRERAAR